MSSFHPRALLALLFVYFAFFNASLLAAQQTAMMPSRDGGPMREVPLFGNYDLEKTRERLLTKRAREATVRSLKSDILDNKDLQELLLITGEQLHSLKTCWETNTEKFKKLADEKRELLSRSAEDAESGKIELAAHEKKSKEIQSEINGLFKELIVAYEKEFDDVILPHQNEIIAEYAAFDLIRRAIPKKDRLLWPYYVAAALDFPKNELAEIRNATIDANNKLIEEKKRVEEQAFGAVLESVPQDKRKKLERYLGKDPEFKYRHPRVLDRKKK
jgi:hypothetical protein